MDTPSVRSRGAQKLIKNMRTSDQMLRPWSPNVHTNEARHLGFVWGRQLLNAQYERLG